MTKIIGLLCFIALAGIFYSTGCASGGSSGRTDYDNNAMFTGQTPSPKHEKKVNLDFFNKVCSPSGNTSQENGKEYDCHYTSD